MSKLYFLKGLPGSGKSTKSKEIMASNPNAVRINKDDIRKMLKLHQKGDAFLGKQFEKSVVSIERDLARKILELNYDLIVDNTHFSNRHYDFYKSLAREGKHKFEVIDLSDVSIETCVERDSLREDKVGRAVIYGMAIRAKLISNEDTQNKKVEIDEKYIVVDLDGTLANCDHRLHYIRNNDNKKNWNKFFDLMDRDTVNDHVLSLILDTYRGYKVVIVTGRPETHRKPTEDWLDLNDIKREAVLMRGYGDYRPDTIVKEEILYNYLDKNKIEVVIDDRKKVVEMWRRNNINVIDVGDGTDF